METIPALHLLLDDPSYLAEPERALEGLPFRVVIARSAPLPEQLASAVLSENPRARILVAAENFTEASAFPLLRLGVKGLIAHSEIPARLRDALTELAEGGFWVPRALLSRFVESILANSPPRNPPVNPNGLTRREREVMAKLLNNSSNKEIASGLHISERTAKFHVSNLLSKYGVRRRADLILLSYSSRKES